MDRFTISLPPELATAFDELIAERGYSTRSEAVRDILRRELQSSLARRDERGLCVASLSYVYDHHERSLAERLTELQHEHHELTVATMHAHLDHDNCLEAVPACVARMPALRALDLAAFTSREAKFWSSNRPPERKTLAMRNPLESCTTHANR